VGSASAAAHGTGSASPRRQNPYAATPTANGKSGDDSSDESESKVCFVLRSSFFVLRSSFFVLRSSFFVLRSSFFVFRSSCVRFPDAHRVRRLALCRVSRATRKMWSEAIRYVHHHDDHPRVHVI
jgi:hypothetical protein